jgi:hypothetical protein
MKKQAREWENALKKWAVTFTGDNWKLTVLMDYLGKEENLADVIERAKKKANEGEAKIKVNGYYEVSEELQYREFDYERERATNGK